MIRKMSTKSIKMRKVQSSAICYGIRNLGFLIFVQFLNVTNSHDAPCDKLLMKGLDKDSLLPWLPMAGIYHFQNHTVDEFPVYKHEMSDNYFYFNRTRSELRFGSPYQNTTVLVGAYTTGTVRIQYNGAPPYAPFLFVTNWFQYDPVKGYLVYIDGGKDAIVPTCLPADTVTCSSGMVEFSDNLTVPAKDGGKPIAFNTVGLDHYRQIPGLYSNQRPVYSLISREVNTTIYLYFLKGQWLIGSNISLSIAWMYVEDEATKPEYIIGTWKIFSIGKWINATASLRCRVFLGNDTCDGKSELSCQNGGNCVNNSKDQQFCQCVYGFRGRYCDQPIPSCPVPKDFVGNLSKVTGRYLPYLVPLLHEGAVMSIFDLGYQPYAYSVCSGFPSPSWSINGIVLFTTTVKTTTMSTTSTIPLFTYPRVTYRQWDGSTKAFVFVNDNYAVMIVVTIFLILMQLFNPVIIWLILFYVKRARVVKLKKAAESEIEKQCAIYQGKLGAFKHIHQEPEEEYDSIASVELSKIHTEYNTIHTEIIERQQAQEKEVERSWKFSRIYSIYSYVTFWIWYVYFVLYVTTKLFGGILFETLYPTAVCMIVILYFIILLEYSFSEERQYINNLSTTVSAAERIDSMRASQPFITMKAEAYHYETRTRTVTYTDANGNLQSRLETYQEKVVTGIFYDSFSYGYWRDTSEPEIKGIRPNGITKIKMTLKVDTADEETATALAEQYDEFCDTYRDSDTYVDFSMERQVPGFEKRLAAFSGNKDRYWWINSYMYLLATFFLVGWPYRLAFNFATSRTEHTISKVIYLRRPDDATMDERGLQTYFAPPSQGQGNDLEMMTAQSYGQA